MCRVAELTGRGSAWWCAAELRVEEAHGGGWPSLGWRMEEACGGKPAGLAGGVPRRPAAVLVGEEMRDNARPRYGAGIGRKR